MERMLAIIFNEESKAYEATRALSQLDAEGSIAVHGQAVVTKTAKGTTIKNADAEYPLRTLAGTAIGSLVGLLAGPVGAGVGALAGLLAGSVDEMFAAGVDSDFLADVSNALQPGKYAVVADVSEEWVTPVDSRMEALHGVVFRTPLKTFLAEEKAREVAQIRADLDQLKAEHAAASADRKAKLQLRIDTLREKIDTKVAKAREHSEQMKKETQAKVQALHEKAAKANIDLQAKMNQRAKWLEQQFQQSEERLNSLVM